MRRVLLTAAVATACMLVMDRAAEATPFVSSSADGFSVDITWNGSPFSYGPVGIVMGRAPPAYDRTLTVDAAGNTIALQPGSLVNPSLRSDLGQITSRASSPGFGVDFISAHGEASVGSVNLLLATNPLPPLEIAGVLGLSLSAADVRSSAD